MCVSYRYLQPGLVYINFYQTEPSGFVFKTVKRLCVLSSKSKSLRLPVKGRSKENGFCLRGNFPPSEDDDCDVIKEMPRQPAVAVVLNETPVPSFLLKWYNDRCAWVLLGWELRGAHSRSLWEFSIGLNIAAPSERWGGRCQQPVLQVKYWLVA